MRAKDLRERSIDDLRELAKSLVLDSFSNRFKNFTNRLDDTSTIKKARRDLARVYTLLREHELKQAVVGEPAANAKPKKAAPKAQAKSAAPKAAPSKPAVEAAEAAEAKAEKKTTKKAAPKKAAATKPRGE
jgi:large subunit ribosomal protein L29